MGIFFGNGVVILCGRPDNHMVNIGKPKGPVIFWGMMDIFHRNHWDFFSGDSIIELDDGKILTGKP